MIQKMSIKNKYLINFSRTLMMKKMKNSKYHKIMKIKHPTNLFNLNKIYKAIFLVILKEMIFLFVF